jgi:hypothetical protein
MSLSDWSGRLRRHFDELRSHRVASVGDKPLFVLEHGLSKSEFQQLSTEVQNHVRTSPPDDAHWLPWIVYAAELGYRYSGDEYWQTFEEETPGWLLRGDRHWIRRCFLRFHKDFGGAKPTGPWAEHFSIICWPITHAILPRDLQRQLARILFELRHSFSAELFEAPETLGEFVAARSWTATSRFQKLAEEPQLLGQIAAALLLQGESRSRGLIHAPTLLRITQDLDDERRARDWLRAAQKTANERAHVRGLAFGRATRTVVRSEEARAEVAALGIEPRLILRPADPAYTRWDVSLEIPDLSNLLFRFPSTRETLTGSRCVVAGAAGRPLARERVLHGSQQVILDRWPSADEVLLQFERSNEQLNFLLRTECLLRPGPNWLFRIASDGLAYELRSLRVRAGQRYLLLTTGGLIGAGERVDPIQLSCRGVTGVSIDVPEALDSDLEDRLKRIGLSPAKTIEVWPAGLAAVTWDGEGHGEWLASERVCLGIRSDHAIASLAISMNSVLQTPLELKPLRAGETVFVELPQLPVGLHKVRVSTRDQAGAIEPLGDLDVMMRIREARPWSPTASLHGPLLVDADPPNPTLEQLWEGHAAIAITGPRGRQLRCRASLYENDGSPPTQTIQLPPLPLPVDEEQWAAAFDQHFRRRSQVQGAYDEARLCILDFAAEELGAFSLRCPRDFAPLRWALGRDGGQFRLRLIDDSGGVSVAAVSRYQYETPATEERISLSAPHVTAASGGLYIATHGEFVAGVIVPPTVRTLADLGCVPVIQSGVRSSDSVIRLVEVYRLWAMARLTGNVVSSLRQRTVLQAIMTAAFRLLCGDAWARAEGAFVGSNSDISQLTPIIFPRVGSDPFVKTFESELDRLAGATPLERIQMFTALVQRYRLVGAPSARTGGPGSRGVEASDDVAALVDFTMRLASDPLCIDLRDNQLRTRLLRLMDAPALTRAVRCLVVYVDRILGSRNTPGQAYAGWSWS